MLQVKRDRRPQQTKILVTFDNELIVSSANILQTLHSTKEKIKRNVGYWVFTPWQLEEINNKLNQLIGHQHRNETVEARLHSIYGIQIKRADKLQNRKSWVYINATVNGTVCQVQK